jgi:tetratricopeptide (TPR) repeat protein
VFRIFAVMRAIQFEFVLKGVFLGLWAAAALRQPPGEPRWADLLNLILWTVGGLAVGLFVAAGRQFLRGVKPKGNPLAYVVYILLEGSFWVYLGLVGGCAAGLMYANATNPDLPKDRNWLGYCVVAGALLGYGFLQLRQVKDWRWRFGLGAAVGAGLVYVATLYLDEAGWLEPSARRTIGLFLLAGLPFFYLLTFCGVAEESEVEIAALCAGMGLGIHLLSFPANVPAIGFLLPIGLYFLYVTKYISGLRGFKHTLRGYGYLNVGRVREALVCFRRARQINPKNALANDGLIRVHQKVDLDQFENDPDTLALLDYGFCLDRAEALLVSDRTPGESSRAEAGRMLELVERQQPRFAPRAAYLRALWLTYSKRFDEAAATLKALLDPTVPADPAIRNAVLFAAWDLALRLHPELVNRIGEAELALPGRRIEAIAATERVLTVRPDDATANELKAFLYAGLSEPEFLAAPPAVDFNYDYVEQLGLALIDDADPARRERGAAYLRIAGHGLPTRGPSIFQKLAEATRDPEAARGYREQVKRSAMAVGVKSLAADQRAIYFDTLGQSVAEAEARGDFASAAADQRLVLESGKSELENYRKLADLYEKAGDPLNALLTAETALIYSGKDADLLARKDKYYYSVTPDRVAAVRDKIESLFDANYCVAKANLVLNQREPDADTLDWGQHLAALARIVKPDLLAAKLAEGRLFLRRGERDKGLSLLEDVREAKASGGDEKEAWYTATRILGDLYLNELNRPDLALACFTDYKEHPKSGADTLFHIAKCYEASADVKNAVRFYDAVTAYEGHPKYWEATEAVRRLKGG